MAGNDGRKISRRMALAASAAVLSGCSARPGPKRPEPPVHTHDAWTSPTGFDRAWDGWRLVAFRGDHGNDYGDLQWRSHYALLALLQMYDATRDAAYLRTAGRFVSYLLSQTDEARGVTDCRGASGPVWRQGATASVSRVELPDIRGVPALELRCALSPSDLATVDLRAERGRFSVTLRHPSQRKPVRIVSVSMIPTDRRYVMDVMLRELTGGAAAWTASVRSERVPANRQANFVEQFITTPGTTGLLTYPIALWARMVKTSGLPDPLPDSPSVDDTIGQLVRAVDVHEPEWTQSSGRGDWVAPKGYPTRLDGIGLPWNQSHALGATVAELYRLTGDDSYREKVRHLIAAWRNDWEPMRDWVQWRHWPRSSPVYTGYRATADLSVNAPQRGPFTDWEDLGHGGLSMEFAAAAAGAGIALGTSSLSLLSRSFDKGLLLDGGVRSHFDGEPVPSDQRLVAAQWLAIANRDPARRVRALLTTEAAVPASATGLLASAYLNLARARKLF